MNACSFDSALSMHGLLIVVQKRNASGEVSSNFSAGLSGVVTAAQQAPVFRLQLNCLLFTIVSANHF
jgi:hypothetical protein